VHHAGGSDAGRPARGTRGGGRGRTPLGGRSIAVAAWDITEHKIAERSLRTSERLNREIISGLLEGVMVVDTARAWLLANERRRGCSGSR
jgi:PAS domain-containing protein